MTSESEVHTALAINENHTDEHVEDGGKRSILYHAYEQAMDRINNQLPGFRKLGMRTIAWIVHAERPLTATQLQHALAINEGDVRLDRSNIRKIETILSVCAGLVTLDTQSNIVRLAHLTTQEYFRSSRSKYFPDAQADISNACIKYLSFDGSRPHENPKPLRYVDKDGNLLSLFTYAGMYWGNHARKASASSQRTMWFLKDTELVRRSCLWGRSMSVLNPDDDWTGLHLAVYFGLRDAVDLLLNEGANVDCRTEVLETTPLMIASGKGLTDIVKVLIAKGAAVQATDLHDWTPLHFASRRGNAGIVSLLLKNGARIDVEDVAGNTPSHSAISGNNLDIAAILRQGIGGI